MVALEGFLCIQMKLWKIHLKVDPSFSLGCSQIKEMLKDAEQEATKPHSPHTGVPGIGSRGFLLVFDLLTFQLFLLVLNDSFLVPHMLCPAKLATPEPNYPKSSKSTHENIWTCVFGLFCVSNSLQEVFGGILSGWFFSGYEIPLGRASPECCITRCNFRSWPII